jgi:predicted ATPase
MPEQVVFCGGPGGGKSTVLNALHKLGYTIAQDSAREIIRARRERGLRPRPEPREFARRIFDLDAMHYARHTAEPGIVFYERGVVDALGMLREAGALSDSELSTKLAAYRYHRRVFLFPPWEAIYANDAERDQSFADAVRIAHAVSAWYARCGYEVVEVPRFGVNERCAFVLREMGLTLSS